MRQLIIRIDGVLDRLCRWFCRTIIVKLRACLTVFGMVVLIGILALALLMAHPAQAQTPDEDDEILTWGNLEEKTHENLPEGIDTASEREVTSLVNRVQRFLCLDLNTLIPGECHPADDPISREILDTILYDWIVKATVSHLGCGISSDALTVTVGQYRCSLGHYTNLVVTLFVPSDVYAHYSRYYRAGSNSWRLSEAQIRRNYYRNGQLRWDAPADLSNPNNVQRSPVVPPEPPSPEVWEEEDDEGELVIENTVEAHNEATGSNNQGSDQYYPIEGGYIRKKNGKCFFNGHDGSYAILNSCD